RLELHRSLCVRRAGFRHWVWSEPLSGATGRRGRHPLERRCLRARSISSESGDGIAGRRRTACTREASGLITCGDISVRIGIRFGTKTKRQCTPSISDDWGEADPERALSTRMTCSAQLAYTGLLHFYGGRAETARMLSLSLPPSRLAIADEVIE